MPRGGKRSTSFTSERAKAAYAKSIAPRKEKAAARAAAKAEGLAAVADLKIAARELTPKAVQRLRNILYNDHAHPATMLKAVELVFDRGWGKAAQLVEADVNVRHTLEEFIMASFQPKTIEHEPD